MCGKSFDRKIVNDRYIIYRNIGIEDEMQACQVSLIASYLEDIYAQISKGTISYTKYLKEQNIIHQGGKFFNNFPLTMEIVSLSTHGIYFLSHSI